MDKEIWKDIEGYEGRYQVSNFGRVRSFANHNGSIIQIPKILKENLSTEGYSRIRFYKNGVGKDYFIHRLVAKVFISNPENKPCVNHINGIKTDNRVENLEFCTYSENTLHAYRNRLEISKKGENVYNAKLTNEQAKQIRKEYIPYSKEYGVNALSRKYKLTYKSMWNIIHNKTYKE